MKHLDAIFLRKPLNLDESVFKAVLKHNFRP